MLIANNRLVSSCYTSNAKVHTSSSVQVDLDELICVDIFVFKPEPAERLFDHLKP
jgi:hypothetical protein